MSIQKILSDIYDSGLSDYEIAVRVDTSQPQINRIRNGKNKTSYELGEKIMQLAIELRPDIYPKPEDQQLRQNEELNQLSKANLPLRHPGRRCSDDRRGVNN